MIKGVQMSTELLHSEEQLLHSTAVNFLEALCGVWVGRRGFGWHIGLGSALLGLHGCLLRIRVVGSRRSGNSFRLALGTLNIQQARRCQWLDLVL